MTPITVIYHGQRIRTYEQDGYRIPVLEDVERTDGVPPGTCARYLRTLEGQAFLMQLLFEAQVPPGILPPAFQVVIEGGHANDHLCT